MSNKDTRDIALYSGQCQMDGQDFALPEGLQSSRSLSSSPLLAVDYPQVLELPMNPLGLHLFRLKQNFGRLK